MPLTLHWTQIALRLALAAVASFLIGWNRDERGRSSGIRTTMLVCMAATLAMLDVNLLLHTSGKTSNSFPSMDVMRLAQGVLSGIGFIGAGAILKGRHTVRGVTTAATMWYVTVLGLLFGGGQLILAGTGTGLALLIAWAVNKVECRVRKDHRAELRIALESNAPEENSLRQILESAGFQIVGWNPTYEPANSLCQVECTVSWRESDQRSPQTPDVVHQLRALPGLRSIMWQE
jgi:putative Mg2+ transporter-C (MgtC) family protein